MADIDFSNMPDGITKDTNLTEELLDSFAGFNKSIQESLYANGNLYTKVANDNTQFIAEINLGILQENEKSNSILDQFLTSYTNYTTIGKNNPTVSDLTKLGALGTVGLFIANTFKDALGVSEEGDQEGLLSGLLGEGGIGLGLGAGGLAGMLAKAIPIAGIIISLGMAIFDGIQGWIKSEDWGVSKISGFIGGFLAGTGSGWGNAFKNAGKWAVMGASTGFLIGGPVGALAGGLIGGAVGGILGFIGGENLAKSFDKLGEMFIGFINSDFIKPFVDLFMTPITAFLKAGEKFIGKFTSIWDSENDSNILWKIIDTVLLFPKFVFDYIWGLGEGLKNFVVDLFIGKKDVITGERKKSLLQMSGEFILNLGKGIFTFLGNFLAEGWARITGFLSPIFSSIKDFFVEAFTKVKNTISEVIGNIVTPIKDFFGSIFDGVTDFIESEDKIGFLKDTIAGVFDKVQGYFASVVEGVKEFASDPIGFSKGIIDKVLEGISGFFSPLLNFFDYAGYVIEQEGLIKGLAQITGAFISGDLGNQVSTYMGAVMLQDARNQQQMLNYQKSVSDTLTQQANTQSNVLGQLGIETVDDAIITKQGQIIRTAQDDNIIATKNSPELFTSETVEPIQIPSEIFIREDIDTIPERYSMNEEMKTLFTMLIGTINTLSARITELEPKIITQTNVIKGLASDPELKNFPR